MKRGSRVREPLARMPSLSWTTYGNTSRGGRSCTGRGRIRWGIVGHFAVRFGAPTWCEHHCDYPGHETPTRQQRLCLIRTWVIEFWPFRELTATYSAVHSDNMPRSSNSVCNVMTPRYSYSLRPFERLSAQRGDPSGPRHFTMQSTSNAVQPGVRGMISSPRNTSPISAV